MPDLNPEVLIWARKTAGLEPDLAAKKLGCTDDRQRSATDRLLSIERGEIAPSRSVLRRMSECLSSLASLRLIFTERRAT